MKKTLTNIITDIGISIAVASMFFVGSTSYNMVQYNQQHTNKIVFEKVNKNKSEINEFLQTKNLSNSEKKVLVNIWDIYQNKSQNILKDYNVFSARQLIDNIEVRQNHYQHEANTQFRYGLGLLSAASIALLYGRIRKRAEDEK